jgi:hypothetical protein
MNIFYAETARRMFRQHESTLQALVDDPEADTRDTVPAPSPVADTVRAAAFSGDEPIDVVWEDVT